MFDMRQQGYRLGAPFGIPLFIHHFALALAGIFLVLGFVTKNPVQAVWLPALYLSVFLHELGHAVAALSLGGRVEMIALHIFGGVTVTHGVRGTRAVVILAAAGPLVNLVLGGALLALVTAGVVAEGFPLQLLGMLAFANLFWAIFNLLPIYPMDGGSIVFAMLSRNRPQSAAIITSAGISLAAIALAVVLALRFVPSFFLIVFMGLFAYINVNRILQVRASQGSARPRRTDDGTSWLGGNGNGSRASGSPSGGGGTRLPELRELATDTDLMKHLLRRCRNRGFGELSPDDRRLIVYHRHLLEEELARRGFDALGPDERELLALHHEIDEQRVPQ